LIGKVKAERIEEKIGDDPIDDQDLKVKETGTFLFKRWGKDG